MQVVNKRWGRHPATIACAASPAQSTAARLRSRPGSEKPVGAWPHRLRGVIRASPRRVGARVLRSANPQRTTQMASKAQNLIGGTAIRSRANHRRFSDLQISNRQQKRGAKEMRHIVGVGGADMRAAPNTQSSTRPRPLPQFLIANPRLEFSLNNRKQSNLKISNRERMTISAVTRTATREQSRVPESTARPKGSARRPPSGTSIFTESLRHGCPSRLRVKSRDPQAATGTEFRSPIRQPSRRLVPNSL